MEELPKLKISELNTGDLVACRTPFNPLKPMSYIATAIRPIAGIRYNHMTVIVKNWGVVTVNEAIARGVLPTTADHRFEKGLDYMVLRPSKPFLNEEEFARKANALLTYTGYDFKGLLVDQLALQLFHHWYGRTGEAAMKKMYCYEYAAYMYSEIYSEWWKIDPKVMLADTYFNHYKLDV